MRVNAPKYLRLLFWCARLLAFAGAASAQPALPKRYSLFSFDDSRFAGERGQLPVQSFGLKLVPGLSSQAVSLAGTNPSLLRYRVVENDGTTNLNLWQGAIRFWFKPAWSSGTGPAWGRLIEVGSYTDGGVVGQWAWSFNGNASALIFAIQPGTNQGVTPITAPINWTSNSWHEVVFCYSPQGTRIIVDGVSRAEGSAVPYIPPTNVVAEGFRIGSDAGGNAKANGVFDEVEILDYWPGAAETGRANRVIAAADVAGNTGLKLEWRQTPDAPVTLSRKLATEPDDRFQPLFSNRVLIAYQDFDAQSGRTYDYQLTGPTILNSWGTMPGPLAIRASYKASPVESRGKVLLIVEKSLAGKIVNDINLFRQDLAGDGWQVQTFTTPAHDDSKWSNNPNRIAAVKSFITNRTDLADCRAVILLGHVPIPHSGYSSPDGHFSRALPADLYYGDTDGLWTDDAEFMDDRSDPNQVWQPRHHNGRGDGRWDNNTIPTNALGRAGLELAVGRIDFANLPAFNGIKNEAELTKQYLAKNHRFRHGELKFGPHFVAAEYIPNFGALRFALRSAAKTLGLAPQALLERDLFTHEIPSLFGVESGYGGTNRINDFDPAHHSTGALAQGTAAPLTAFAFLAGSFYPDFAYGDNLMRSYLAAPDYTLACASFLLGMRTVESMGLGETLGSGMLQSVQEFTGVGLIRGVGVYFNIIGDPTLRMSPVNPVSAFSAKVLNGQDQLSWAAPADEDATTTYQVYRAPKLDGSFIRLNAEPVLNAGFTNTHAGSATYMIRATKLVRTGSGSYTNLSQGVFTTVP